MEVRGEIGEGDAEDGFGVDLVDVLAAGASAADEAIAQGGRGQVDARGDSDAGCGGLGHGVAVVAESCWGVYAGSVVSKALAVNIVAITRR